MSKWPNQNDVDAFYGNPRGRNGNPSPTWEAGNIVRIATPWSLVTAWDLSPVRTIRVHRKCSDSLNRVLALIWQAARQKQSAIEAWGMHLYGGGYNFRLMRGSNRLSMHSWGCAVDFDPARNGYGDSTPHFANVPEVLAAFAGEEWTWGGDWRKKDGMHWQAAQV
jgi:hypothetical protein